jgi:hypothetical protein
MIEIPLPLMSYIGMIINVPFIGSFGLEPINGRTQCPSMTQLLSASSPDAGTQIFESTYISSGLVSITKVIDTYFYLGVFFSLKLISCGFIELAKLFISKYKSKPILFLFKSS